MTNQNLDNPTPVSTYDINVVQSNKGKYQQRGSKKKGKGSNKQESPPQEKEENQSPDNKKKPHYPCLICNNENFIKECPRNAEINRFFNYIHFICRFDIPFPKPGDKYGCAKPIFLFLGDDVNDY